MTLSQNCYFVPLLLFILLFYLLYNDKTFNVFFGLCFNESVTGYAHVKWYKQIASRPQIDNDIDLLWFAFDD